MSTAELAGTTAVVTGASRGFGRATAAALAASGARVVGVARNERALKELGAEIGAAFVPEVADVAGAGLAERLLREYEPRTVVLNAGAAPPAAPIQDQTWASFNSNWEVDVRHVFNFVREALRLPLRSGAAVISLSSGAALRGSPLSGGYAGSKATIKFLSSYAGTEAQRNSLGIRFVSVLPQITSATELGAPFVKAYADYNGMTVEAYLEQLGSVLTVDQVARYLVDIAANGNRSAAAYLLTGDGLNPLE